MQRTPASVQLYDLPSIVPCSSFLFPLSNWLIFFFFLILFSISFPFFFVSCLSEGTTYAALTTFANLAGTVAFDLSTLLTKVWDVSQSALQEGDFSGVFKLSLLCTFAAPVPLLLINLIPADRASQDAMLAEKKRTWIAGVVFVGALLGTMALTFAESIYEVRESTSVSKYEVETGGY